MATTTVEPTGNLSTASHWSADDSNKVNHLRRAREVLARQLPTVILILVLGCLVLPILVEVVIRSIQNQNIAGVPQGWTTSNYSGVLTDGLGQAALNTLILAVSSSTSALFIGGGLAWLGLRTNAVGARALRTTIVMTFVVPPLLFAYSWVLLIGPQGPVYSVLSSVFGIHHQLFNPYSLPSLVLLTIIGSIPISYLLFSAVLSRRNVEIEEAAQVAGLRERTILWRITIPMMRPAIVGAVLLSIIFSITAFDLPAIIGLPGNVKVLSTGVWYAINLLFPANYGIAASFAVMLLILVVCLVLLGVKFTAGTGAYTLITNRGSGTLSAARRDLGRWRYLGLIPFAGIILIAAVGPLGLAAWASFLPFYLNPSRAAFHRLTFNNFSQLWSQSGLSRDLINTLVLCFAVATVGSLLTAYSAWISLRRGRRAGMTVRLLCLLPLVFPSVILGLAEGIIYVRFPLPIYQTLWLLLIAYVTQFLPLGYTFNLAGMYQIHRELEESAYVSGIPRWRTLFSIVFPLAAPTIAISWVLLFILSSKDLAVPLLLSGANSQVLSVAMYNTNSDGNLNIGLAMAIFWTGGMMILLGGGWMLLRAVQSRRSKRLLGERIV